ncbi:MAG TPA: hypothetical protein VLS26_05645 [Azonexus sp.]|nr:hypothetical protein [Azonexus sp.]
MNLYDQPIEARINWLFSHAKRHAESFASPETWLARKRYLAEHPTAIGVEMHGWPHQYPGRHRNADGHYAALPQSGWSL